MDYCYQYGEDTAERTLTVRDAIEYRSDSHRNSKGNKKMKADAFPSPSLNFSYCLETKHDNVVINCDEVSSLSKEYRRVDVDVYVSPLSYDYSSGKPTVTFVNKPQNFHIKVLVPGVVPQPADDRPPYGLGSEIPFEKLSLCTKPLRVSTNSNASTARSRSKQSAKVVAESEIKPVDELTQTNQPELKPIDGDRELQSSPIPDARTLSENNTPTKTESGRKRRRSGADEPKTPETRSAKRQSLHRSCKLTDSPKETSARSTRRKPNPAFT